MIGNFPEDDFDRQKVAGELEVDFVSDRLHRKTSQAGENFRSRLTTNTSVNSESVAETSRAIHSEISSQLPGKREEVRIDLNAHVLEAINSAIEEKLLPAILNALNTHSANSNAELDLRSDGPHQNTNDGMSRKTHEDFPKVDSIKSKNNNHHGESSVDSYESDDGYDTYNFWKYFVQKIF